VPPAASMQGGRMASCAAFHPCRPLVGRVILNAPPVRSQSVCYPSEARRPSVDSPSPRRRPSSPLLSPPPETSRHEKRERHLHTRKPPPHMKITHGFIFQDRYSLQSKSLFQPFYDTLLLLIRSIKANRIMQIPNQLGKSIMVYIMWIQ